jgi:glycosyltransferase involved in cell wall biosynthesis
MKRKALVARNVAVISQLPPPVHGSTVMTATLLDSLKGHEHDIQFVNKKFSRSIEEVGGFSLRKLLLVAGLAKDVWKACSRKPSVIILFATTRRGSFLVDTLLHEIIRHHRIPTILYIHTVGFSELAEAGVIWRLLVRKMFAKAARVVVLSEKLIADLKSFATPDAVAVIENCLSDRQDWSADESITERRSISFISNLIPSKGALDFVHVAASLESASKFSFEIVGADADKAYKAALEAAISQIREKTVVLHGAVFGKEKELILRRSRILVFPSTYKLEAQPLTLIEALRNGIPVVAYDTGGVADIIENGREGFVVSQGDRHALRLAVEKLANDDVLWEEMSRASREKFSARFSRQAFDNSWKELVNEFS